MQLVARPFLCVKKYEWMMAMNYLVTLQYESGVYDNALILLEDVTTIERIGEFIEFRDGEDMPIAMIQTRYVESIIRE